MNNISKVQNQQKQLERLSAQRELYSSAKNWHIFQIWSSVVIPIIFAVVALSLPSWAVPAAIYGVVSFIVDIVILTPVIKKRRSKAAKIQELFDCDVLNLPKSPLKTVDDITVEEVLIHYNAHSKIKTNVEKIKNWYSVQVSELPIEIARILCQRTNCWWDSKIRKKYSNFLRLFWQITFSAVVLVGFFSNLTITEVTLIASGLIPLFQFCINQCTENKEASNRLSELVHYATRIWNSALEKTSHNETLLMDSRRLQDEIFEHRTKSPLILDLFYKLFRDEDEALMNRSSEILVEEAKAKLRLQG